MNPEIRLTRKLYDAIRADLVRPHPFAWERIGFVYARLGNVGSEKLLVLLHRYQSIPDDYYVDDPDTGARIGGDAIRMAMQEALSHKAQREGVFHIHLHEHTGKPGLSATDREEIPLLIPSFQSVNKNAAHGFLVLSEDHGRAWVWLPGQSAPACVARIVVVGAPLEIFEVTNNAD